MKTLMYPIAPEDDFPETFCAIRQGSGEHQFYTPEGESASWILFCAETENTKMREQYETVLADYRSEVAKLRELVHDLLQPILSEGFDCYGCVHDDCNGMQYADRCKLFDRARELGVEVTP